MPITNDFDLAHLWHPYNRAIKPIPAFEVTKAYGRTLELKDGTKLIDGMSSWWCCAHGYNVPEINSAIKKQVEHLAHVMFGGLTHEPAVALGQRLLKLLPSMHSIFYADSGSVATEIAMKMALQYQYAKGQKQRTIFATISGGYHGDTWNAMSVCDPNGMHHIFSKALPIRVFAPRPLCKFDDKDLTQVDADLKALRAALTDSEQIAAMILEPIVQGAGGMHFYHPKYLDGVRALCDELGLLLIADEIATGFGRSAKTFAFEHSRITPDIVLLGKALTGGYMTLSAVLCTKEIATVISENPPHAFMHGPTYMANPLACSAACAAIDYMHSYHYLAAVKSIEQQLKCDLAAAAKLSNVRDVRVLGAIGVIEMDKAIPVQAVSEMCLKLGIWLRPMGNLLYCMPPFTTTQEELAQITSGMLHIAKALSGDHPGPRAII